MDVILLIVYFTIILVTDYQDHKENKKEYFSKQSFTTQNKKESIQTSYYRPSLQCPS